MQPVITEPITIYLFINLILATINDLRFNKIPNILNFSVIGISLIYYTWNYGFQGFIFSVSGTLLGIALLIGPYLLGGMGAGDAKLMGAVGAVLGPKGVFIAFLYTSLVGGIYAAIMMLIHRDHGKAIISTVFTGIKSLLITHRWVPEIPEPHEKSPRLCYGLAIALGTFFYLGLERFGLSFISI